MRRTPKNNSVDTLYTKYKPVLPKDLDQNTPQPPFQLLSDWGPCLMPLGVLPHRSKGGDKGPTTDSDLWNARPIIFTRDRHLPFGRDCALRVFNLKSICISICAYCGARNCKARL